MHSKFPSPRFLQSDSLGQGFFSHKFSSKNKINYYLYHLTNSSFMKHLGEKMKGTLDLKFDYFSKQRDMNS